MGIDLGQIIAQSFVAAARVWGEELAADPWPWLGIVAIMFGLGALRVVASPRRRRSR